MLDQTTIHELAAKLDQLNTDRQEEERRILQAAEDRFTGERALCDAYCIVIDGDRWHRARRRSPGVHPLRRSLVQAKRARLPAR